MARRSRIGQPRAGRLCGKDVDLGNREFSRQIRLDYYVEVKPGRTKDKSAPLIFIGLKFGSSQHGTF